ncbi:hypothetical protein [Glaciimonas immobilis]|uniref:Uncharacterized protein n=1 Tax=Glaciimonas immobilis TaxID=728004 RepID=A0A840RUT3_9BURK|nr:hypothetical protein [Glaciimonas immobilis]KAF3997495.1 hypothetical protein HAV38_12505 [Glaciimonas immobilis]MBB5200828.1 hypothetical protein [Glaciimonas immobilis]
MMNIEQERKEFESAMEADLMPLGYEHPFYMKRSYGDKDYIHGVMQHQWEGWQRHAALSQPQGEPVMYQYSYPNQPGVWRSMHADQRDMALEQGCEVRELFTSPPAQPQAPYPVSDYARGQWWLEELEGIWVSQTATHDQKRAAHIALEFAKAVFDVYEYAPPAPAQPVRPVPLSEAQIMTIRASISPCDGWDGDDWDCALTAAVEKHHGILATQEAK